MPSFSASPSATSINKILIIGYVWPEPNSSAAGSRMLQLIHLCLSQNWQVIFASPARLSEHRINLEELGVEEKIIALNCSSFDDYIAQLQPDVVIFDRFFTEEQFGWRVAQKLPKTLRILNTEDLHSLRHVRQQLLKSQQKQCATETEKHQLGPVLSDSQTLFQLMTKEDMAQREIAAIYRCDISLMISDVEMQLLQQQFSVPSALLHYCPFLLGQQPLPLNDYEQRQDFMTIGNFRHEPNWDAVLWLKHALWPLIRQQLPQAQLKIYGAYPPPKATALHNAKQGFQVLGWTDDAHQVMREARVCLAPLRFGAGIKGKLIDAMVCGTPSVTTRMGAEAMNGEFAWPGIISDTTADFSRAAVALYTDQNAWREAQNKSQVILQKRFNRDTFSHALIDRVQTVFAELDQHRTHNFVGAMLQHHQHKSTQYMSQWIEAKNKR
jgi:glycosyltransferase involved in cell wall biosynthesis